MIGKYKDQSKFSSHTELIPANITLMFVYMNVLAKWSLEKLALVKRNKVIYAKDKGDVDWNEVSIRTKSAAVKSLVPFLRLELIPASPQQQINCIFCFHLASWHSSATLT
jgi:hypothetical protein